MPTLGEIIKAYRSEHDMSMDDFAKASGISKAYISVLEKNKRPGSDKPVQPSVKCVLQAAKAMGVDGVNLMFAISKDELSADIDSCKYVAEEDRETVRWAMENNLAPVELPDEIQALNTLLRQYKYDIIAREGKDGKEYAMSFDNKELGSGGVTISEVEISEMVENAAKHLEIIAYNVTRKALERQNREKLDKEAAEQGRKAAASEK